MKKKGLNFDKDSTIEIAKTFNGYALKIYFNDVDSKGREFIDSDITLFEMDINKEDGEKEALEKLLYAIAEALGITYDKWKDNNLNITFNKKGSKME
jgi:hypothetical protein